MSTQIADSHLIYRGSDRFREDYEVQDRATGVRLGYVNKTGTPKWTAVAPFANSPKYGTGRTRWEAALKLWPEPRA